MDGGNVSLENVSRVHLVGIGGAGMSALAHLLKGKGLFVSGCDMSRTTYVEKLIDAGIPVSLGHDESHLDLYSPDLVVYSSAIACHNTELQVARARHIPLARRAEVLSLLFNCHRGIGIAGTHGKTTTSSMISLILDAAGRAPTVAIGGELCDIGGNAKLGSGPDMVAELDESDGSFELFTCDVAVVTNVDWDHVDHYPDVESVRLAFGRFLHRVKEGGTVVACAEDMGALAVMDRVTPQRLITYGWGRNWDWGATDVQHIPGGGISFSVRHRGVTLGNLSLKLSGEHNVLNALAACAVSGLLEVPFDVVRGALGSFRGAKRRLQLVGTANGITIYDDYGHHPREVAATLRAVRQIFPGRRLLAVFQPHRYTRTGALYKDFSQALALADESFLLPIYPADEDPLEGVSSALIAEAMAMAKVPCHLCFNMKDAQQKVLFHTLPGDVVLTVGAGNVCMLGGLLLQAFRDAAREHAVVVGA